VLTRFTDRGRQVLVLAQDESRLLAHDRIGTEHLLLGLLRVEDDETASALQGAGVTLAAARRHVEQSQGRGRKQPSGHIPFTQRAKKVLELSLRVSQRLGGQTISEPHVLRAILDVRDSTAHHPVGRLRRRYPRPGARRGRACARQPARRRPGRGSRSWTSPRPTPMAANGLPIRSRIARSARGADRGAGHSPRGTGQRDSPLRPSRRDVPPSTRLLVRPSDRARQPRPTGSAFRSIGTVSTDRRRRQCATQ
jgi:hypothetical protein